MLSAPQTDFEQQRVVAAGPMDASRDAFVARQSAACDPVLRPLIRENDELRRDQLIERLLVDSLGGIIKRTLQRKLNLLPGGPVSIATLDDIRSTVFLRLLKRLRLLSTEGEPIENLAGYATAVTLNAWEDSLREAFPQRTLLKNRIRFVLRRDHRFALWTNGGHMVCGFAEWQATRAAAGYAPDDGDLRSQCSDVTSLPEILLTLFRIVDAPVELEAVVTAVARISGINDEPVALRAANAEGVAWTQSPVAVDETEDRDILRKLWGEIMALNLSQRTAFLLNLRDETGDAATPLFVTTGIASIAEIAATLAIPVPDFAMLWNDLPIEDAVIARILGVTRQRVINLRSAARKRLARRMRRF